MAIIVRLGEKRLLAAARSKVDEEYPEGGVASKSKEKASSGSKKRKGESSGKEGKKAKK